MTLVVKFHWIWSELLYIIFASYSITLALPIRHGSSRCHSVENAWAIFSNFYVCLWILTILIKAINRKVWDYWGTRPCSTMCIGTHLKCEKIQLNSRYTYSRRNLVMPIFVFSWKRCCYCDLRAQTGIKWKIWKFYILWSI